MSTMTLEQVRDAIRARPYVEDSIMLAWADAIDAHLAGQGGCVMDAYVEKAVEALRSNSSVPTDDYVLIERTLRDQEAEIADLKVDRDSWADQASDRVKDWDDMRQRAEKAEALLRETLRYLDPRHYSEIIKRITAHLGGERE